MNRFALPTQQQGHECLHRQSGFSLLEVLIVMTIVAALTGLSVAWLEGDDGPTLESARQQLRLDLERAALQAMASQQVIGLLPQDGGYRFVTRPPGSADWQPLPPSLLPPHQWAQPVSLSRQPRRPENEATPWVVWWPGGEVMGGRLRLATETRQLELVIDLLGVHDGEDDTERRNGERQDA